jgi:hypothetical protein
MTPRQYKRGRGISLAAGSLRTCPVCLKPRGTVIGLFVEHIGADGKPCKGSGRPAATVGQTSERRSREREQ